MLPLRRVYKYRFGLVSLVDIEEKFAFVIELREHRLLNQIMKKSFHSQFSSMTFVFAVIRLHA